MVFGFAWGIDSESDQDEFLPNETRLLVVGSEPMNSTITVTDGRRTLTVRRRDLRRADI
jgi:hypothetical protein